jgi:hypothetical protein
MRAIEWRPTMRANGWPRALAFAAMLAVAFGLRADIPTEWDSWEYAARAIHGDSVAIGLGRWWFVLAMHSAFRVGATLFGLTPQNGYLAMQVAAALMMAGALVALMAWTWRLTQSRAAEIMAAALVLPGPVLGLYGAAVMTEGMALLFITSAFLAWEEALARAEGRGWKEGAAPWALGAGLAFGIAVDVREPALLFAAWPILSCLVDRPRRRWRLLALAAAGAVTTFAVGIVGAWAWSPRADGYLAAVAEWAGYMTSERQRYPANLAGNLLFFASASLAALPVASVLIPSTVGWALIRRTRMLWLIVATLPYAAANLLNHDLVITGRYAIPFVWLLVPAVASATVDLVGQSRLRRGLAGGAIAVAGCIVLMLAWPTIRETYFDDVDAKKRVLRALLAIPQGQQIPPVIVAGESTPVASLLVMTGARKFQLIEGGWAWPRGQAAGIVARHLRQGAAVYVNVGRTPASLVLPRDDGETVERIDVALQYDWDVEHWPLVRLMPRPSVAGR